MRIIGSILRRELGSYFATPLAYVFILAFVTISAALAFYPGGFYERNQADLQPFFQFHPWLYLFLVPAVSMRLWAEERRSGSIELLLTQPITPWQAVAGKFLAAWTLMGIALALSFPAWLTVSFLGEPDHGVILAAYIGSLLMAGALLSIGSCMSALTQSQVVAFILGVAACFVFLLAGQPMVLDLFRPWAPGPLVDSVAALSFLGHFEAIAKGVLDLRDLLYFATTMMVFLTATCIVLAIPQPGGRLFTRKAALPALGAAFIALTTLSNWGLRGLSLDLTENGLYTTSPGTLRIVQKLTQPVELLLFYSADTARGVPGVAIHAQRVREFLEELVTSSSGKLKLTVLDPQPFSEEEDLAAQLGVRPVPIGAAAAPLYLGLAGRASGEARATIGFLDPSREPFLEYEIARLVQQLGDPRKPVVGWLSGLHMQGGLDPSSGAPTPPWTVLEQAQQLFEIRPLRPGLAAIAPDLDVLVIAHPDTLPPETLFAIDQHALRGGRILLLVDPITELDESAAEPGGTPTSAPVMRSSSLEPLLGTWGVGFDRDSVVVDLVHGLSVALRPGEPPTRHIGILGLDRSSMSRTDVVTANLSRINVASTGHLVAIPGATTRFEPLVESSTEAGLLPATRFRSLEDPETLLDGFRPTGRRYTLAARITGKVRSAFPQGPPSGASVSADRPVLLASSSPLNLVVLADADLLSDLLWVRQQDFMGQTVTQAWANNGDLIWNAIDNLAGGGDLIGLRGRESFARPFGKVDSLRRAAEARLRSKEQELESQLTTTEQQLSALETRRTDAPGSLPVPAQQAEIERFQREKSRIRSELRGVRRALQRDIDSLGTALKLANIAGVPLLFAGLALVLALWRRRLQSSIAGPESNDDGATRASVGDKG